MLCVGMGPCAGSAPVLGGEFRSKVVQKRLTAGIMCVTYPDRVLLYVLLKSMQAVLLDHRSV